MGERTSRVCATSDTRYQKSSATLTSKQVASRNRNEGKYENEQKTDYAGKHERITYQPYSRPRRSGWVR